MATQWNCQHLTAPSQPALLMQAPNLKLALCALCVAEWSVHLANWQYGRLRAEDLAETAAKPHIDVIRPDQAPNIFRGGF